MKAPSFQLKNVGRTFGERIALRQVSVEIPAGQIVALAGPSGAGKSTLIRLLAGVLKPTTGHLLADGKEMASWSWREVQEYRGSCRIIEQGHLLVTQLSVHQNTISGHLALWPWYKVLAAALWPIEKERVRAVLDSLGIAEHQFRIAGELSGGQMQRVAIARALISDPRAIFADEPTASLDPNTARAVTETILAQARARGVTLIFCTNHLSAVLPQCDRVIGLREGELVLDSPASSLRLPSALNLLYENSDERQVMADHGQEWQGMKNSGADPE